MDDVFLSLSLVFLCSPFFNFFTPSLIVHPAALFIEHWYYSIT